MRDRFGRKIEYLRVSITQRCNLRCIYCRPDSNEQQLMQCTNISPTEFASLIRPMAALGIKKVRITGGEPLIRTDVCEIIRLISEIPGIEDISMTTNGIYLADMINELKKAGLKRINISLDSLRNERFKHITGGGQLDAVLKGIDRSLEVGLNPVKINTVLMKGINDDEVMDFIELAKDRPIDVRFIELMPVGRFGEKNTNRIVCNDEIIAAHPEMMLCTEQEAGAPARYYKIEGFKGRIGFISPMSHRFCTSCNRIRLTCDGKIKPCLGENYEVNVIDVLRSRPEEIGEFIRRVIYCKPEGHTFLNNFKSDRNMNMIGG